MDPFMSDSPMAVDDEIRWFAVQTASNQEAKVKRYIERFVQVEGLENEIREVLVPTKTVMEVKGGKKITKTRKFYPGYVFIRMHLFDGEGKLRPQVASFVRNVQGVLGFVGGEKPTPLRPSEMENILGQLEETKGKKVLKVEYEVGECVKIMDGPFLNFTGKVDEADSERGKLRISVSIFGRFTPVELEYWQVERAEN
jgi:transcriptional antiterminator NusG